MAAEIQVAPYDFAELAKFGIPDKKKNAIGIDYGEFLQTFGRHDIIWTDDHEKIIKSEICEKIMEKGLLVAVFDGCSEMGKTSSIINFDDYNAKKVFCDFLDIKHFVINYFKDKDFFNKLLMCKSDETIKYQKIVTKIWLLLLKVAIDEAKYGSIILCDRHDYDNFIYQLVNCKMSRNSLVYAPFFQEFATSFSSTALCYLLCNLPPSNIYYGIILPENVDKMLNRPGKKKTFMQMPGTFSTKKEYIVAQKNAFLAFAEYLNSERLGCYVHLCFWPEQAINDIKTMHFCTLYMAKCQFSDSGYTIANLFCYNYIKLMFTKTDSISKIAVINLAPNSYPDENFKLKSENIFTNVKKLPKCGHKNWKMMDYLKMPEEDKIDLSLCFTIYTRRKRENYFPFEEENMTFSSSSSPILGTKNAKLKTKTPRSTKSKTATFSMKNETIDNKRVGLNARNSEKPHDMATFFDQKKEKKEMKDMKEIKEENKEKQNEEKKEKNERQPSCELFGPYSYDSSLSLMDYFENLKITDNFKANLPYSLSNLRKKEVSLTHSAKSKLHGYDAEDVKKPPYYSPLLNASIRTKNEIAVERSLFDGFQNLLNLSSSELFLSLYLPSIPLKMEYVHSHNCNFQHMTLDYEDQIQSLAIPLRIRLKEQSRMFQFDHFFNDLLNTFAPTNMHPLTQYGNIHLRQLPILMQINPDFAKKSPTVIINGPVVISVMEIPKFIKVKEKKTHNFVNYRAENHKEEELLSFIVTLLIKSIESKVITVPISKIANNMVNFVVGVNPHCSVGKFTDDNEIITL